MALGAAQAGDLLLTRHFEALGCRVAVATEDGSSGRQGLVTGVAETLLEEGGVTALAACGPAALLDAVAEMGRRWDLPTEVSREAYMRCGIGVCGSCAHEGRLVCKDGPVFTVHPTPNEVSPRQTRQLPDLQVTQMTPPPKE